MQADVHKLAYDPEATRIVESVARAQYKRRGRAYDELALLGNEDLAQELWLSLTIEQSLGRLLEAFVSDEQSFRDYVTSLAEVIAQRGVRKAKYGHSIPISRLTKQDKSRLWHKRGYSLEATFDELYEKQEYWG